MVKARLDAVVRRRQRYNKFNLTGNETGAPRGPDWGYGRIDAIGSIFNQATAEFLEEERNARKANAPVSIPFIWDTPQHKIVEWNGEVENSEVLGIHLGALGRNVGEVLGVFGELRIEKGRFDIWPGYPSSIRLLKLKRAEDLVRTLWSPQWPKDVLGQSDDHDKLVKAGKELYKAKKCIECHVVIDRASPDRHPIEIDTRAECGGTATGQGEGRRLRNFTSAAHRIRRNNLSAPIRPWRKTSRRIG